MDKGERCQSIIATSADREPSTAWDRVHGETKARFSSDSKSWLLFQEFLEYACKLGRKRKKKNSEIKIGLVEKYKGSLTLAYLNVISWASYLLHDHEPL